MDERPRNYWHEHESGPYLPPAHTLPAYPSRRRAWLTVAGCAVWLVAAIISAIIFGAVRTW